jgi:hypothetical protein
LDRAVGLPLHANQEVGGAERNSAKEPAHCNDSL